MTSRRLLRLAAAGCFTAAAVLLAWAPAGALTPEEHGWWFKGNQDPVGVLPVDVTPPNVPEGGLYVANDPSGPAGLSALRFHVPEEGSTGVILTLTVADSAAYTELEVVACPAMASWVAAAGGDWGLRPEADCTTASVAGAAADDGATVSWELDAASFAPGGTYDVVLVPDPASATPFQIPFEPPDDGAVQPSATTATPTTARPTFELEDLGVEEDAFAAPDTSFSAPAFEGPGLPDVGETGTAATGDPAGQTAPPPAALPPALVDEGFAVERGVAVALLVALGGGLWLLSGRPTPAPKLIGGLAGHTVAGEAGGSVAAAAGRGGARRPAPSRGPAPLVGGIGRFARPRTGPPTRV